MCGELPWRKNLHGSMGSLYYVKKMKKDEENGRKWKREDERRER